jgi:hypothetical protein
MKRNSLSTFLPLLVILLLVLSVESNYGWPILFLAGSWWCLQRLSSPMIRLGVGSLLGWWLAVAYSWHLAVGIAAVGLGWQLVRGLIRIHARLIVRVMMAELVVLISLIFIEGLSINRANLWGTLVSIGVVVMGSRFVIWWEQAPKDRLSIRLRFTDKKISEKVV